MSEQTPESVPGWKTDDQVQAMIDQALAKQAETYAAASSSPGSISAEQAQAMIDQALARQAEAHNAALQQLADSLRGQVISLIPHNGGGPGTVIAETWSQAEQTAAHAADAQAQAQ